MTQTHQQFNEVFSGLMRYVKERDYAGVDPYDGLNSVLFQKSPFNKNALFRFVWIQVFRRSPVNFRGLARVPASFNAKAGALFLLGYVKMAKLTGEDVYIQECRRLFELLQKAVIKRNKGIAFGYNFDWQAKAFYVPTGVPNIVTTVYIGHALMDYDEYAPNAEAMQIVEGIKDFILNEMIIWEKEEALVFGYIPGQKTEVHNANLMAASLLSRIYEKQEDKKLKEKILKSVNFSIEDIRDDGYWPYGNQSHHVFMDNFHTAFNLEALLMVRKNLKTTEYDDVIQKVFQYYLSHMFLEDGTPKYYHNHLYPVDSHTIAEAIIFLNKIILHEDALFSDDQKKQARALIESIFTVAARDFRDKKGYFYYQKLPLWFNKIPYMRWSQAWMFYALSCYREVIDKSPG